MKKVVLQLSDFEKLFNYLSTPLQHTLKSMSKVSQLSSAHILSAIKNILYLFSFLNTANA